MASMYSESLAQQHFSASPFSIPLVLECQRGRQRQKVGERSQVAQTPLCANEGDRGLPFQSSSVVAGKENPPPICHQGTQNDPTPFAQNFPSGLGSDRGNEAKRNTDVLGWGVGFKPSSSESFLSFPGVFGCREDPRRKLKRRFRTHPCRPPPLCIKAVRKRSGNGVKAVGQRTCS